MNITLVSQHDITSWANSDAAKSTLPSLVRRLILNSPNVIASHIHFPAYEEVVLGGYDGELTAASKHHYVPNGDSVFELSVRGDVGTKANDDYDKRKETPGEKKPEETTYVSLTIRRWANKETWQTEKNKEKVWKEVKAYDITDIYTWLEQDPLTHLWLTEEIKGQSVQATSATAYWKSWELKTEPKLHSKLILSGRIKEASRLIEQLKADASNISIKAPTVYEGVLFSISAILEQNDEQLPIEQVVVVNDDAGMGQVIASKQPLVIITTSNSTRIEEAVAAGHKIISILQPSQAADKSTLSIPLLNSESVRTILTDGGMDHNEAYRLGKLASRSFFAYLRAVATNPASLTPAWLSPENISVLTTASLLGSWNDNSEADRLVIEKISGKNYEEYEAQLTSFELLGDSPVIHRGDNWSVVDKNDLITLVRSGYTKTQLTNYFEASKEMLQTKDPKYDLPMSDWYMARVLDKRPVYSENLTDSVPSTLAILASKYGDEKPNGLTYSIQDNVNMVVRAILEAANNDDTGKLWLTISGILSPLAEAAPEVFIEEVEKDLRKDTPILKSLFVTDDGFFSSSPYTSLVWALEHLSWNEEYHTNIVLILGRLNELYTKSNVSPNPMTALNEIFSLLHKRPILSDEEKLEVLELLIREHPETAKTLMFALIPEFHNSSMGLSEPEYRRWSNAKGQRLPLTYPELYKMEGEVISRLLPLIKSDEDKLELIGRITNLPLEVFDSVIAHFKHEAETSTDYDSRQKIWSKMNEVIAHHRQFPNAKWTYPAEKINELELLAEEFAPVSDIARDAYLFDHHPRIPNPTAKGWEADQELASEMQNESAKKIYTEQGFKGIEDLAKIAPIPGYIGKGLSENEADDSINDEIAKLINREDKAVSSVAHGYLYNRSIKIGTKKVLDYIAFHKKDWTEDGLVSSLIALPLDKALLEFLKTESEEIQKHFWAERSPTGLGVVGETDYIASQYIKFDLLFKAFDFIGLYANRGDNDFKKETIITTLEKAASASFDPKQVDTQMFSYHASEMFKMLDEFGVDDETIVRLEMMWLSVIKRDRPNLSIYKSIAQEPDSFIELLKTAYKGRNAKRKKLTKSEENQAYAAHELLDKWNVLPGKLSDGTFDRGTFEAWVTEVREKATELDRIEIADQLIGGIIVKGLPRDGDWPPDSISELLDKLKSDNITSGILTTAYNTGGMIDLAESKSRTDKDTSYFNKQADRIQRKYPFTARILRRLSEQATRKHQSLFRHDDD